MAYLMVIMVVIVVEIADICINRVTTVVECFADAKRVAVSLGNLSFYFIWQQVVGVQ